MDTEPIAAPLEVTKTLTVVIAPDSTSARARSYFTGDTYETVSEAHCRCEPAGAAPCTHGRCGFHANRTPQPAPPYAPTARCALWGRVVEHGTTQQAVGYRAQFQQLLSVRFPPRCVRCEQRTTPGTAALVAIQHRPSDPWRQVHPYCRPCSYQPHLQPVDPAHLGTLLGCPVTTARSNHTDSA